jgi:hypothetical protein
MILDIGHVTSVIRCCHCSFQKLTSLQQVKLSALSASDIYLNLFEIFMETYLESLVSLQ